MVALRRLHRAHRCVSFKQRLDSREVERMVRFEAASAHAAGHVEEQRPNRRVLEVDPPAERAGVRIDEHII